MFNNFWTYYVLSIYDNSLIEITHDPFRAQFISAWRGSYGPILSVGRDGDVYYTLNGKFDLIRSDKFEVSHA